MFDFFLPSLTLDSDAIEKAISHSETPARRGKKKQETAFDLEDLLDIAIPGAPTTVVLLRMPLYSQLESRCDIVSPN